MVEEFNCPNCGAPLPLPAAGQESVSCRYCGANLLVPAEHPTHDDPPEEPPAAPARSAIPTRGIQNNTNRIVAAVAIGVLLFLFTSFLKDLQKNIALQSEQTRQARAAAREMQSNLTLQVSNQTAFARRLMQPFNEMATQQQAALREEARQSTATAFVDTATAGAGATLEAALLQTQLATLRAGIGTPQAWTPVFSETFTAAGAGWPDGDVRNAYYSGSRTIQDGAYHWNVHPKTSMLAYVFPEGPAFSDGYIRARARLHLTPEIRWGIPIRVDQETPPGTSSPCAATGSMPSFTIPLTRPTA